MADWISRDDFDLRTQVPFSTNPEQGTEQQVSSNDHKAFYDALFAAELAKAQKSRGPAGTRGRPGSGRGGGGVGLAAASGIASNISEQLGDPEVLRAMGLGANNWGQGATGALESRDRINRALLGGTGYDGGFSIGAMRKTGPGGHGSSGFGTPGVRFNPGMKQKNEYEKRAEAGRQADFDRGQKRADLNLELEFERKRRADFIKQLKQMIGSSIAKTRLQSGSEQVTNFAGLPVKVPTKSFQEESNLNTILSLLK